MQLANYDMLAKYNVAIGSLTALIEFEEFIEKFQDRHDSCVAIEESQIWCGTYHENLQKKALENSLIRKETLNVD